MKQELAILLNLSIAIACGLLSLNVRAEQVISLEQAIAIAQQNDPWQHGNKLKQTALEERSIASGSLPDPQISLGLANLPTDTWNFNQEGMTQFKVGISQMFPRGDSLGIKQDRLKTASTKFPLLREDRRAKVKQSVSELWFDAYLAQQTIRLIEKDRVLFEQMADVVKASYSNVIGKIRQQDVIRAQLEIVQLDDRLTAEKQKFESAIARLNEWLVIYNSDDLNQTYDFDRQTSAFSVSEQLPHVKLTTPALVEANNYSRNALANELLAHPAILAIDVEQEVADKGISLTKQQYKPQWGVNASYGYRDNMQSGEGRADLFSVGVTFDLPLFTGNKQDKEVAASIAESEAVKTEKLLLVKKMLSAIDKELQQLKGLSQRQSIYNDLLLKQTHDQAEAALTAYTNDDGDFAEVVRSRIAELNAKISSLQIEVDTLKAITRINYFLTQSTGNNHVGRNHQFGEE